MKTFVQAYFTSALMLEDGEQERGFITTMKNYRKKAFGIGLGTFACHWGLDKMVLKHRWRRGTRFIYYLFGISVSTFMGLNYGKLNMDQDSIGSISLKYENQLMQLNPALKDLKNPAPASNYGSNMEKYIAQIGNINTKPRNP